MVNIQFGNINLSPPKLVPIPRLAINAPTTTSMRDLLAMRKQRGDQQVFLYNDLRQTSTLLEINAHAFPSQRRAITPILCRQKGSRVTTVTWPNRQNATFTTKKGFFVRMTQPGTPWFYNDCEFIVDGFVRQEDLKKFRYDFFAIFSRSYYHVYLDLKHPHIISIMKEYGLHNLFGIPALYNNKKKVFTDKGKKICKLLAFFSLKMFFCSLQNADGSNISGNSPQPYTIKSITPGTTESEFEYNESLFNINTNDDPIKRISLIRRPGNDFSNFAQNNSDAYIETVRFTLEVPFEFVSQKARATWCIVYSVCLVDSKFLVQIVTHYISSTPNMSHIPSQGQIAMLPPVPSNFNWEEEFASVLENLLKVCDVEKKINESQHITPDHKQFLLNQCQVIKNNVFHGFGITTKDGIIQYFKPKK